MNDFCNLLSSSKINLKDVKYYVSIFIKRIWLLSGNWVHVPVA
jgi:hypothetical protein